MQLSSARAEAVRKLIVSELGDKVFPVPVEVVVALDDERTAVTVEAEGKGSREAVVRHGGKRESDEEADRAVDIDAEMVTTEQRQALVHLPPKRHSAFTREWMLTVTGFREIAAGVAVVDVDLEIKNPLSGQVATGSARLYGGGVNVGLPTKSTREKPGDTAIGSPDIKFSTDKPVGFGAFDGRLIRMGRRQFSVGIGHKALTLVFIGLSKKVITIQSGWKLGKPAAGGYLASGELHLDKLPPDSYETDEGTKLSPYKYKYDWGENAGLTFQTGSAHISERDRKRIEELVAGWAKRFE